MRGLRGTCTEMGTYTGYYISLWTSSWGLQIWIVMYLPQEVDMQLKRECEQFISDASALLLHPVKHLLSKYDVIVQVAERDQQDPGSLVHRQPFAAAGQPLPHCMLVWYP